MSNAYFQPLGANGAQCITCGVCQGQSLVGNLAQTDLPNHDIYSEPLYDTTALMGPDVMWGDTAVLDVPGFEGESNDPGGTSTLVTNGASSSATGSDSNTQDKTITSQNQSFEVEWVNHVVGCRPD